MEPSVEEAPRADNNVESVHLSEEESTVEEESSSSSSSSSTSSASVSSLSIDGQFADLDLESMVDECHSRQVCPYATSFHV